MCISTAIITLLASDKIKSFFAKVTWDDRISAFVKNIFKKKENKKDE
jgi:hypothetical protein